MNRDEIYEMIIKDDEDLISELYGENHNRPFKDIKAFKLEDLEGLEVTLHTYKENNYEALFGHDKKNNKVYMLSEVYRIDSREVF